MKKSQLIILFLGSFLLGVALYQVINIANAIYLLIIGFSIIINVIYITKKQRLRQAVILTIIISFMGLMMGSIRMYSEEKSHQISYLNIKKIAKQVQFYQGIVVGDGRPNSTGTDITIKIFGNHNSKLITALQKEGVKILLKTSTKLNLQNGDILNLEGKLSRPYNFSKTFSYSDYLLRNHILLIAHSPKITVIGSSQQLLDQIIRKIFKIKHQFMANLQILPLDTRALGGGILVGARELMPDTIKNDFIKTNLVHIIAMSGFNITILIIFVMAIFTPFIGKKLSAVITMLLILSFIIIAGSEASIIRAGIMGLIGVMALANNHLGRTFISLLWAGFFMILYRPELLLIDVGLQLSFLATAGIIFYGQKFSNFFEQVFKNFMPQNFSIVVAKILGATLAAELFVIPVLVINFAHISLVGLFTNLFVEPILPLGMALTFMTGISIYLNDTLYYILGYFSNFILGIIIFVAHIGASFDLSYIATGKVPWYFLPIYFLILTISSQKNIIWQLILNKKNHVKSNS